MHYGSRSKAPRLEPFSGRPATWNLANALICLFALAVLSVPEPASASSAAPGVLVLHSNQRVTPAAIVIENTLRKVVPEKLKQRVEF